MALTDENGSNIVMPVAPMGGNGGFGGFGGNDWGWIILLLLFAGGGWGNGFGGGAWGMDGLYPWLNNSQNINGGFRDSMLNDNITSIRDGVQGLATQMCNSTAGIQQSIAGGFANAEIAANARQIADMQTAFAGQTAMAQGFNGVQSQLAQCCGDNRLATANLSALVQSENCADRAALSDGIRDILVNQTANTQKILDTLCADKIEQKNDTINQLRSELLYARGQASQDVQTAAIQLGQRNLANEVEQYVAPRAIPAYVVQNPNCCQQTYACGCGAY